MKFILGVFVLLFNANCQSQTKQKDDYSSKIDSLIKTDNTRLFNGTILISQKGKIKYSKVFGFRNNETKSKLELEDKFLIMSNSKQVTAVLILKEVEKGKINLQSTIKKYLPELKDTWADSITVHQLLNHTSGIDKIGKPLLYKSGTSFNYGNQTFKLLGKIIEFSTKKSFAESANALFKECEMTHTFCYEESKKAGIVSGHSNKNNSITVIDGNQINTESIPADGIVSNVKDLAIWDVNLHKGKILKPETYKLMTSYSVKAQHDAFGEKPIGYGYGIRINDDDTIKMIGHTGMGSGFTCVNFYFPESETSLIVLENHMNNNIKIGYYFESEIRKIILKSTLLKPTK